MANPWVMDLPRDVVLNAAHACYALEYANVFEDMGGSFGPVNLYEAVDRIPDELQLPIIYRYIGRIERAWGYSISLVFHHMGLKSEKDMTDALTDLLLGSLGHGVNLKDDFAEELKKAEDVLCSVFEVSPIYFEGTEWRALAEHYCEEALKPIYDIKREKWGCD